MRLLNTLTGRLEWVDNPAKTSYAILSHVWTKHDEPCGDSGGAFQDVTRIQTTTASGSILPFLPTRIQNFCKVARNDGFTLAWTDACCLDRANTAELSESINSMFSWYGNADVCYAFLHDVHDGRDSRTQRQQFRSSEWFTRGWTLQELLAPRTVVFLSSSWTFIGSKHSLASDIELITGIGTNILLIDTPLYEVPVARRMSWAASRKTTLVEDEAYSLMGIFGVHIPTAYGEGARAFQRLQEEIFRRIPDQSLFAWEPVHCDHSQKPATPCSPTHYAHSKPETLSCPPVSFRDERSVPPRGRWTSRQPDHPSPSPIPRSTALAPFTLSLPNITRSTRFHETCYDHITPSMSSDSTRSCDEELRNILADIPRLHRGADSRKRPLLLMPPSFLGITRAITTSISQVVSSVLPYSSVTASGPPAAARVRQRHFFAPSPRAFAIEASYITTITREALLRRAGIPLEEAYPDPGRAPSSLYIRLPVARCDRGSGTMAHEYPVIALCACEDEQRRTLALVFSANVSGVLSECCDSRSHICARKDGPFSPLDFTRIVYLSPDSLEQYRRRRVFHMVTVHILG